MEFDRRVQIRVTRRGKDKKGFGTGYLVAPRLILTAHHVLDGLDLDSGTGAVTVCQPDSDAKEYPAMVVWHRRNAQVDAALIEIDADCDWPVPESLSDLTARPPQRYGRLIGTRSQRVALTGFPRFQKDPAWGRLDEQVEGVIAPGTGALAGRYEITSITPTPQGPLSSSGTRWSGISGAAVLADDGLAGDLLCGIIRYDRQADGGTRLTATPISHLLSNQQGRPSRFCHLITEHTGWEPVLEPIEPAHLFKPATVDRDLDSPAAMLRADTEAVAFHGRDQELADLRAWCTIDPEKIAIRVVTGPGGQGKTRLARRLADTLSRENWVTGHLRSDLTDHDAPPDFTPLNTALPLLLVVDYAETRPRLLRRLVAHLHATRHRVRLLVLARSDGEWRTDTLSATPAVRRLLAATPVVPLGPLQPAGRPDQDRSIEFRNAVLDLARLLPRIPSVPDHDWLALARSIRPPVDLRHPRYDNALTLQLTALVALLQHGPRPAAAAPGAPAEEILLEHEERFWEDSAQAPAFKLGLDTTALRAAVAVAALCGAAAADSAARVLVTVPGMPADKTLRTAAWLARLYPADPDRYWGSLQPDRIAEFLASRALTRGDIELSALLGAASPDQQAQSVTVLARAAIAHYNGDRAPDSDEVLGTLDAGLDGVPLSYQAISDVVAALPHLSHVVNPLAVRLADILVHVNRYLSQEDPAAHEHDLAHSLSSLGSRLSEAGRRVEALAATEEAVEIRRRLALGNPAAHEHELAASLTNLSGDLSEAGRRAEALTAAQEAVEIYRRREPDSPNAFEHELAVSLSSLSVALSGEGRRVEALAAAEDAVEIQRRLVATDPVHEPDIARALSTLGSRLSEVGRWAEALAAVEEGVEVRRRLAAADPAAFERDLATSLSNLGGKLSEVGRWAEALTTMEEEAEIRRRLAAADPISFEPDFATSLSNLGVALLDEGRRAEALTTMEEAAEIRRRLAAADPAAFEPELATLLSNLGVALSEAGRWAEALAAAEDAVEIHRRWVADNPVAREPGLARSLSNLSNVLSETGRQAEALTVAEDAVEVWRSLVAGAPGVHEHNLAGSLSNLGTRLRSVGRPAEGLTVTEDAVGSYRRLAADNPVVHEPNFARSLSNLSAHLWEAGRLAEALTAVEEAVEIRRRLAVDNPAAHQFDLVVSLSLRATVLANAGELHAALNATDEAVESCRPHVATMPSLLLGLHQVLDLQAQLLEALGRQQDAATVRRWLEENPLSLITGN
ncbi:tetratricopeptide repeat protein [Kitasatospora sp. NPDC089913]|uniref:tetratricopeptide repeat protein n=1 Tax=Kitasatospora sp. NPDC089913 TaxID=3364080 RepID=UPI00382C8F8E